MLSQPLCGPNEVCVSSYPHTRPLTQPHLTDAYTKFLLQLLQTGLTKNLLPYSVTPPRPAGPTEAQRKIEELTRQLEEEIEQSEEHGEYFGTYAKALN